MSIPLDINCSLGAQRWKKLSHRTELEVASCPWEYSNQGWFAVAI